MKTSWGIEFPENYKGFILNVFLEDKVLEYQKKYLDESIVSMLFVLNEEKKYTITCRKLSKDLKIIHDFKYYSFNEYKNIQEAYHNMFNIMKEISLKLIVDPWKKVQ